MPLEITTNNLITHPEFQADKTAEYFNRRGWSVAFVKPESVELVKARKGAAVQCPDGRFGDPELGLAFEGPKIWGGINVVAAMVTGGDAAGFTRAARLIEGMGYAPGTHGADHGGCGYFDQWSAGKLTSALYHYDRSSFPEIPVKMLIEELYGGKHFILPGRHVEVGVSLNPYYGLTEKGIDCSKFRVDDWFLAYMGVPNERRYAKIAEVVEILRPEAANLEIVHKQAA